MSIAAKAHQAYDDVVTRLRNASDDYADTRSIDRTQSTLQHAINAVAGLLSHTDQDEELRARIAQLETEVEVLRRRDRVLSHTMSKLDEEQRLAMRIQQDFLPKSLPQIGSFKFYAAFRPAHYVSGDLYDVARLDESHVGVYLADAVGHGMPAALLTMFMRNALVMKQIEKQSYRLVDPSETLLRLNSALRDQNLASSSFATAIYARVDTNKNEVCFSRGGHPSPMLMKRDGTITPVEVDGSLLGVFDDETWPMQCVTLEPGERLFFYTDGIELAFNNGSEIGGDQWKQQLIKSAATDTQTILNEFVADIDQRSMSATTKDDLTIVVVERT